MLRRSHSVWLATYAELGYRPTGRLALAIRGPGGMNFLVGASLEGVFRKVTEDELSQEMVNVLDNRPKCL